MGRRFSRPLFLLTGPLAALVLLAILARWGPMDPLFDKPSGTVLLDRNGGLLGATVATDGQWRMAPGDSVPTRFQECLLEFEDRHFFDHMGVHVPSMIRAWRQNRRSGRTVSGGSTITMQIARMSGDGGSRTHLRKAGEILRALRLELQHDKHEILAMYTANAPFGANVVGLEAAAWRWFGRSANELSWAENALLAVLPNAPALLHPGRNREALKAKRDRLLGRLHEKGSIDPMEYSLALDEPLPEAPVALPRRAPHLLATLAAQGKRGQTIRSTLDGPLQDRVVSITGRYAPILRANEVHNAAVLVMEVKSGEVIAYVGNLDAGSDHAPAVDVVQASRSTGSLLKPFLYAAMLQAGELMPDQLVADLPTRYAGFAPKNFDRGHSGAVPASTALARSLNIPAVRALHEHGIDRTLRVLRGMGLHRVNRNAGHYGLSLIVGGAESSLWELTGAYASLARTVSHYSGHGSIDAAVIHPPVIISGMEKSGSSGPPVIHAAAAWHTIMALQQLNRPEEQQGWQHFGAERIAWKTGTSFGHRDAWAIGVTDRYVVGVWTGNASGEGRPGLTGTLAAAPLMFEIFGILPDGRGFDPPYDDMKRIEVCAASGHRASVVCDRVDAVWTISTALRTAPCPYHQRILVDHTGKFRSRPSPDARAVPWFVLPPAMEYYYAAGHPEYKPLPPFADGVQDWHVHGIMEFIYPTANARIHVPIGLDGGHGKVVLEAAHRDRRTRVHWDLDGVHLGSTHDEHRLPVDLSSGAHRLTLTDALGNTLSTTFHVEKSVPAFH